jgi:hypothetical protein
MMDNHVFDDDDDCPAPAVSAMTAAVAYQMSHTPGPLQVMPTHAVECAEQDLLGDLLAACKASLRIGGLMSIQLSGGPNAYRAMDDRSAIETQIKAAIAKAESTNPRSTQCSATN